MRRSKRTSPAALGGAVDPVRELMAPAHDELPDGYDLHWEPGIQIGDVVVYRRGRAHWPAIIVALYSDDVADLVVFHAPTQGECSTFAGRVPRTAVDQMRGDMAGWDLRPFVVPFASTRV